MTTVVNRVVRGFMILLTCASLLTLWMLGAIITIQIDSERAREYETMDMEITYLKSHIDDYCGKMNRRRSLLQDLQNVIPNSTIDKNINVGRIMPTHLSSHKSHLIYIRDLKQMWCLVPKAASTSWSKLLIQVINENGAHPQISYDEQTVLRQNKTPTPFQTILRSKYQASVNSKEYDRALKSTGVKKILLVRHPFARLVSAYEDKLKNRSAKFDSMFFYQFVIRNSHYGVQMNRKFRPKYNKKKIKQKEPTFKEFLEYIIHTDPLKYDEHWQPISRLCGICTIHYDHVIRQEDLEEMSHFHLTRLGFPNDLVVPHRNKMGTTQIIQYYKNISRQNILKLISIYQDDFYAFDYKFLDFYIAGV